MKRLAELFHEQTGATAIEYGLIAALVAIAAIAAMQGFSNELQTTMNTAGNAMSAANATA